MDNTQWMLLIGAGVAIIGGYFVARQSHESLPVRGGAVAEAMHYIVCAMMAGIPAAFWFVLVVTIFTADNLFADFVRLAIGALIVILAALLGYALSEPDPAPADPNTLPPLD